MYCRNMASVIKSGEMVHYGNMILVNKNFKGYTDGENVVPITDGSGGKYVVTDLDVSLERTAADHLNEMLGDFYDYFGETDIMVACGYRSYATQSRLYEEEIEDVGEEDAAKWVARPGYSEHQTGLAVDLNLNISGDSGIRYEGTGIYSWINENSCDYGFILRYPLGMESVTGYEYEPWHFRYVGKEAARYITYNDLTLEEYLDIVHAATPERPIVLSESEGVYTYFVHGDPYSYNSVAVPEDYYYELSGNNYDGFIVTVYDRPAYDGDEESDEDGYDE